MGENVGPGRFSYVYGDLEKVLDGWGSSISNISSNEIVENIFKSTRKKGVIPVIGVFQQLTDSAQRELAKEIYTTSEKIIEGKYGSIDTTNPRIISLIYDFSYEEEKLSLVQRFLQQDDEKIAIRCERVSIYPSNAIPVFNNKRVAKSYDELMKKNIFSTTTEAERTCLEEGVKELQHARRMYGLTLPEYVVLELMKRNSSLLPEEVAEPKMQKVDIHHFLNIIGGSSLFTRGLI